jgi:formimidoylglutamase
MGTDRPFRHAFEWRGPSSDPNDEQFGDVVERATLAETGSYDALLVGEPYDGAVLGRRGAREGPGAVREHLAGTKTHHFDAGPVGRVGDLGDVRALADEEGDRTADVRSVQEAVCSAVRPVYDVGVGALPVFVGGDNSMTVSNARPLVEAGSAGVVSLDAHLDCREVRGDATSGTPYRQLYEAGLDAFAVLGARHFETSTVYHDYVRERGGEVVTAEEVGADPVDAVDRALEAAAGVADLFVSLDCDVLDAAAAPGVSAPTPGGIASRELFRVLRLLADDDRLAGFEVVECAPPLDESGRTAATAARAVAHVLAAAGAGRRGGDGGRDGERAGRETDDRSGGGGGGGGGGRGRGGGGGGGGGRGRGGGGSGGESA